jgi:hypothetical protein
MDKIIQFKDESISPEFDNINSRLRIIIYALAGYCWNNFGKPLTITELLRTWAMQDEYYKDDPKYQLSKFMSVHQVGRGADISLKYYTGPEIEQIKAFLSHFLYCNGDLRSFLVHDMGFGAHLHLQVSALKTEIV